MNNYARRASARFTVALLLTILLAAVAALSAFGDTVKAARPDPAVIEREIQVVRDLKLKHKVPIVELTAAQASAMLEKELDRDYSPERLDTDGRSGAMIGLYPRGINLKASNLHLLRSQVMAFYNFHSKEMVLVKGALEREVPIKSRALETKLKSMILAHEFTHALQDQNFDFGAQDKKLKDNSDRELALHAVAEGDATIAGYAYMLGAINPAVVSTLASNVRNFSAAFTAATAGVPRGVAEPLIFQYTDGVRFVALAYQHGGWAAVDKLYANPPQSTQQIIHPSLYYDHPVPPDKVVVAGYRAHLPGWKKVDQDTMGELGLRIILENTLGTASPRLALASKWAGDRVLMLRKGKAVGVIWLMAFRSAEAAKRFGTVYREVLNHLHARDHVARRVEIRKNAVLVVLGEPAAHFAKLGPAVWKQSRITAGGPAIPQAGKALRVRTYPAHHGQNSVLNQLVRRGRGAVIRPPAVPVRRRG